MGVQVDQDGAGLRAAAVKARVRGLMPTATAR
jgi:hypothetical protein